MLQHLTGTRYVVPLREGGSLPAVVDTGGNRMFVVKFKGAGQGAKALVAEAIAAGLAVALELPVPEPAIITLGDGFGRNEPDEEIQDILRGSVGANFGLAYLPGALGFDPATERDIEPELAADIIWFDAYITNVDRTPRNTNLLVWKDRVWMIDHGAALYFHHQWQGWRDRIQSKFPRIQDHVLLGIAGDLAEADERLRPKLDEATIREIIDDIPEEWLGDEEEFASVAEYRAAYVTYLMERLNGPRPWLQEAIEARERGPVPYTPRVTRRVV